MLDWKFLVVALALIAACGSNPAPAADGPAAPDAPDAAAPPSRIRDVQRDQLAPGTAVELHGVIVTAVDSFGATTGDFWVEEQIDGELYGVRVVDAPGAQVVRLVPGDFVDITGAVKGELARASDVSGRTITVLQPPQGGAMTVSKSGTGVVPPPQLLDAAALAQLSGEQRDAAYERWEGVLVEVRNVNALSPPTGTTPSAEDALAFEVTGKLVVESRLARLPATVDGTTCLASVIGVEDYVSDWLILPRTTADVVAGGTDCPPPASTTVAAIQAGTIDGLVQLSGVYVTARELTSTGAIGQRLWVSDALQGASRNGVMLVFDTAIDPSFAVGARVDVRATIAEISAAGSETLTALTTPRVTLVSAPAGPPVPAAVTVADVGDLATSEPFEGVLVQLTRAKVTALGANHEVTLTDHAGRTVILDDDVFANYSGSPTASIPAVGTCFDTLIGVMSVQTVDNVRTINPRSAADMVVGTSCSSVYIQDVQSDLMPPGTPVQLDGVIVTAIDQFAARAGDLWVEERGGGPFSGVHVFGAPPVLVAQLAVGDVVAISGAVKTEFVVSGDLSGRTVTELTAPSGGAMMVTKRGIGVVPAPALLDAVALDALSPVARDAELEQWEGVLVQISNVHSRSYPRGVGRKPFADDAYRVAVSDALFVASQQTSLASIDGLTCFASVTGVQDYLLDWLLVPRSAADIVQGTSCAPVPITSSTIPAIQSAGPAGVVELDGVYVTGVSSDRTSFWMATSPTAAPTQGGYVFQLSTTLPLDPAIVAGVQVNVVGTVTEFNDDTLGGSLTELVPLRITVVNATPAAPIPITGLAVSTLLDPATAPLYESVLVTLDNVNILGLGSTANGVIATATQNGTTFGIGADTLQLSIADLACFKTITGFWTNLESTTASTKPNAFGLILRDLGTRDGTCN